jgi:prephenate dehydrogenase
VARTKTTLGIVGFGDFGKLLHRHLSSYFDVVVSSSKKLEGVKQANLDEVLASKYVIPSFPAQFFDTFFGQHGSKIKAGSTVIDVCSVKTKPLALLKKHLPESVSILGTHPMFGPQSATNGLQGLRMMMHPTRISPDHYQKIKHFLINSYKLHIIECTPEEHDQTMAYVQGLSHYIGRVMDIMRIPETELTTTAYADLLDMRRIQGSDSWELFYSIMHENPYAHEVNAAFKAACQQLDDRLKTSQPHLL